MRYWVRFKYYISIGDNRNEDLRKNSWTNLRFISTGTRFSDFQSAFLLFTGTGPWRVILISYQPEPEFGYSAIFGYPLFLNGGIRTRWKLACIQNKHTQYIHTCILLLTIAVYAHTGQESFSGFLSLFRFLLTGTGILKSHSVFISPKTRILAILEFRFLIRFRWSPP